MGCYKSNFFTYCLSWYVSEKFIFLLEKQLLRILVKQLRNIIFFFKLCGILTFNYIYRLFYTVVIICVVFTSIVIVEKNIFLIELRRGNKFFYRIKEEKRIFLQNQEGENHFLKYCFSSVSVPKGSGINITFESLVSNIFCIYLHTLYSLYF